MKETQDKLKTETDASSRLRKQYAEMTVEIKQKEASLSEYNDKLNNVQSARDALEREVVNLQTQLERFKSHKINQEENIKNQLQAKVIITFF